jgi:ankyrin repeat protein
LIDGVAGINESDFEGNYPLHCAVKARRVELVKTIIDAGADVGVRNKAGRGVGEGCGDAGILAVLDAASKGKTNIEAFPKVVADEHLLKDDRLFQLAAGVA